jgi:hypothetical protein
MSDMSDVMDGIRLAAAVAVIPVALALVCLLGATGPGAGPAAPARLAPRSAEEEEEIMRVWYPDTWNQMQNVKFKLEEGFYQLPACCVPDGGDGWTR